MADPETGEAWSPQRVWVPLCSGLTYSNRSNCLLTDKAAETNIAGESFNIFKTVAVYFNTRKLTRDEGDQNLRQRDYLRGPNMWRV